MERTNNTDNCLEEVLDAYNKVFHNGSELFSDEPSSEDIMKAVLEDSMEVVYLERAKAFCFFRRTDVYTYLIEYLGTRPEFQGCGLGGRLLDIVVQLCATNDPLVERVELLCPDDRVSFYERHGFMFSTKEREGGRQWNKMIRLTKNVQEKLGIPTV
jgi:GNAT superfamily N-acetyltransferase